MDDSKVKRKGKAKPKARKPHKRVNFDPNQVKNWRSVTYTVKLTFADWDYRAQRTVMVGGNIRGLEVIELAVEQLYEDLQKEADDREGTEMQRWDLPLLILSKPGKQLYCEDDQDDGEDWLKNMLIKAEIVDVQQDEKEK